MQTDQFGGVLVETEPATSEPVKDQFGGVLVADAPADLPALSPSMADQLGAKRWEDPQTGAEVRRAELVSLPKSQAVESPRGGMIDIAGDKLQDVAAGLENAVANVPGEIAKGAVDVYMGATQGIYNALATTGAGRKTTDATLSATPQFAPREPVQDDGTTPGVRGVMQGLADEAGRLRTGVKDALTVDPNFEKTYPGMIAQGVGQLAGLPLYGVPGLGTAVTTAQLYQEGIDDYTQTMQAHGQPVDMAQADRAATAYLLAAAPVDVLMDKLIVGKALKEAIGKATVGELAKTFAIMGGAGAVSEAGQQAWLNTVAKELEKYDPERPVDQGLAESFIVGGIVSGLGGSGARAVAPVQEAPQTAPPASQPDPATAAPKYNPEKTGTFTDFSQLPAAAEPAPVAAETTAPTVKESVTVEPLADDDAELDRLTASELADLAGDQDAAAVVAEAEQELAPVETDEFGGVLVEDDTETNLPPTGDERFAPPVEEITVPEASGEQTAKKTLLDIYADEVVNTGAELRVEIEDPKNFPREKAIRAKEIIEGRGLRFSYDGKNILIQPPTITPEFVSGLRGRLGTAEAGAINLDILRDIVGYGRTLWQKGVDFVDWSVSMVKQLGEKVTPYLRQAFEAINGGGLLPSARQRGSVVVPSMESRQQAADVTAPLDKPPEVRTMLYDRAKTKLAEVIEQVGQQTERLRNVGTDTSRLDNTAEARLLRFEQENFATIERLNAEEAAEIEIAGAETLSSFMDRIEAAKTTEAKTALRRDAKMLAKERTDAIRTEYKERRKSVEQRAAARSKLAIQERNLRTTAKDEAALKRAEILGSLAKLEAVLSVLPSDVRGRIGGARKMASLTTDAARLEYLQDRVQKVAQELEAMMSKIYDRRLQKLFKRARPAKDKAGKMTKGKAGADVHSLFSRLQQALTMTPAEADARVTALQAEVNKGEMTAEEETRAVMEMNLLPLVADWENLDAAARAVAIEELTKVFERGYIRFQMDKFAQRDARKARRGNLIADTGKSGSLIERKARQAQDMGLRGVMRKWGFNLSSFEQITRYIFGDQSPDARRLADLERRASNQKDDAINAKLDGIDMLFRRLSKGGELAGQKLQWSMSQPSMTVQGIPLSEMEGITATLMWRQEDGKRHMQGEIDPTGMPTGAWHYNQKFVDEIEANLSPEARQVRDWIAAQYAAEYETLNPTYRALNGIDMPKNENYSPLTVKPMQAAAGQTVDPVTGTTVSAGSNIPGSLRRRGQVIAEPEFRDALQTFVAHAKQMEHWKAYAPFSQEARALLGNRDVRNAAEARSGEEATKVLGQWLDFFEQGGTRDAGTHLAISQGLQSGMGRAAAMALVGRAGTIMIQSTQLGAALAEMPTGAYLRRMSGLLTGQMGWGAAIRSPYIQRRIAQMPVVVRQALEGLSASKPNAIKHAVQKLGGLIGGADALFTAGTYAMVYDWQLKQGAKQGLSGAELETFARDAAERITDRVAQPTRAGTRSIFENRTVNPLGKSMWAFASEARKNLGLLAYNASRGEKGQGARTLAFVFLLNGLAATIIRNAWRDMRDEDDDEILDPKNWNPAKMFWATVTEPLYGIPVVGEILQGAILKTLGYYVPEGNLLGIPSRTIPAIKRLPETLTGGQDMEGVVKDAQAILAAAGLANDTIAAATSLANVAADMTTLAKNFAGDNEARPVTRAGKKFAESQGRKFSGLGDGRADLFGALVAGDRADVVQAIREKTTGLTGAARKVAADDMRAKVSGLSPLRMAAGSTERIPAFRVWAAKNAPDDLLEIDRMEARYKATAAGLVY